MIGEINIYGVYVPALLGLSLIALVVTMFLRRFLRLSNFYRLVWHPALFDIALYIIALGMTVSLTLSWAPQ